MYAIAFSDETLLNADHLFRALCLEKRDFLFAKFECLFDFLECEEYELLHVNLMTAKKFNRAHSELRFDALDLSFKRVAFAFKCLVTFTENANFFPKFGEMILEIIIWRIHSIWNRNSSRDKEKEMKIN